MQISESSINKAKGQIIVNCLYGNTSFVLYEDPLKEIDKICSDIDEKLTNYFTNPFVKFCVPDSVLEEVIQRMTDNNWEEKKTSTSITKSAVKKLLKDVKIKNKDEIIDELVKENDSKFIERLKQKSDKEKKKLLERWRGEEIKEVEKKVYEAPKAKTISELIEDLIKIYKETKTVPELWLNKKPKGAPKYPSSMWIKNELIKKYKPELEKIRNVKLTNREFLIEWIKMVVDQTAE